MTELEQADGQFRAGRFIEARQIYADVANKDPECQEACVRLGEIDLLCNKLDLAMHWLGKACALKPGDNRAKTLLVEAHYRRDQFQEASALLKDVGREAKAAKLESFTGTKPYLIEGLGETTALIFEVTDPLPLVRIQVNGSDPVLFLIDTGGAELVLDSEFAKEIGARQFGPEMGTFAGGLRAAYQHGRVDKVQLGDFMVHNVPVSIMETRRFGFMFGARRVDGVIGTVLLYHFIPTMDYAGQQLVLRRRTRENLQRLEQEEHHSMTMPFWMAGDHFMHAWGTVNKSELMLFFIDTGLAGGGFTCPESTLRKANIRLEEDKAGEGLGGGGKVRVVPFMVDELTLGAAVQHNIRGLYSGGLNEYAQGFHCGGIISHAFFRPYALTMDFDMMRLFLRKG